MNLNKKESKEYNTVEVGEGEARRRQNGCGGGIQAEKQFEVKKNFSRKKSKEN